MTEAMQQSAVLRWHLLTQQALQLKSGQQTHLRRIRKFAAISKTAQLTTTFYPAIMQGLETTPLLDSDSTACHKNKPENKPGCCSQACFFVLLFIYSDKER